MWSSSVIIAVCFFTLVSGGGNSSTSGFPTFDDIRGNASLIDRFSIPDGELRSLPVHFSEECFNTGSLMITRIIFIALPGVGNNDIELVIRRSLGYNMTIILNQTNQNFGEFGYEQILSQPFQLMALDSLLISQPLDSGLRLLYQVGDDMLNISWSSELESHQHIYYETTYDYPLLAIETNPLNCIIGLQNISKLRNMWEHRPSPLVYTSPYIMIQLNCNGIGTVTRILAGGYYNDSEVLSGYQTPYIEINDYVCNLSTQPALDEHLNVFECILDNPVPVLANNSLHVHQRNSHFQIVSIYDGETDVPLISIDVSGQCDTWKFVSEDDLMELANFYIPAFVYIDNEIILFTELQITQPGHLVKWTFAAHLLDGVEYPSLAIYRGIMYHFQRITTLTITKPFHTIYSNMYESVIDPPIPVQAGDIVGLVLPGNARLSLIFLLNNESVGGESLRGNGPVDGIPLVSLDIDPLSLSTTEPSVLQIPAITMTSTINHNILIVPTTLLPCSPDTMCDNNVQETNESDVLSYIIIGVVCTLCLLIAVTIIILLILVWFKRQRRKSKVSNTVSYYNCEIETDGNIAYQTVNIDITTSSSDMAYVVHNTTEENNGNHLEYDYVKN